VGLGGGWDNVDILISQYLDITVTRFLYEGF
jgi:hypothetical protein